MPEETHEFHDTAFVIHLTANKELRHPYIWYNLLKCNCCSFFKEQWHFRHLVLSCRLLTGCIILNSLKRISSFSAWPVWWRCPRPVYSSTPCMIEPHKPYTVPLAVERLRSSGGIPDFEVLVSNWLSWRTLSSQWHFTYKALVQNIKKGTPQTLFLCFKDCDFVKLDPVVYSGENHWLQQIFLNGFGSGPMVLSWPAAVPIESAHREYGLLPPPSQMMSWTGWTGQLHRTSKVTQATFSSHAGCCFPIEKTTGISQIQTWEVLKFVSLYLDQQNI